MGTRATHKPSQDQGGWMTIPPGEKGLFIDTPRVAFAGNRFGRVPAPISAIATPIFIPARDPSKAQPP